LSDYLLERKVAIFKALSHPIRLAIAERLQEGERCVCDIAQWFPCDRTTISKHLAVLRNAGIIADRKEGLNVYYSLVLACLGRLSTCLDGAIRQDALENLRRLDDLDEG
jgi:ArsR family transcriptional regulator